jgi:amino acid transporter
MDAVGLTVGIVLGAGIFKTPSLVAANAGSEGGLLLAWLAGGLISLVGALCYAELATTYPSAGGDYHFLYRALGRGPAFLFAWARLTVIPTGSIALLAFAFGDYASQLVRLGEHSSSLYAALVVVVLTAVNILGVRQGTWTQNALTLVEVLGLVLIIGVGLGVASSVMPDTPATMAEGTGGSGAPPATWGLMMVFVLLTYGGWNEAAYMSAEIRGPRRNLVRALMWSIGVVTALYLLVNVAYLHVLGLSGMARSEAVAADLMQHTVGSGGAWLISVLIAVSALTSANATILLGARTNYAFGRDFPLFSAMGRWHERTGGPTNALLVQGAISLGLVGLGSLTRQGFQTMVEYTAPIFWLFFLLTGVSLIVLRVREPNAHRPFRVPLYPLTPLLFCATCAYVLYSSLAYTGLGALVGVAVLAVGGVLLAVDRRALALKRRTRPEEAS